MLLDQGKKEKRRGLRREKSCADDGSRTEFDSIGRWHPDSKISDLDFRRVPSFSFQHADGAKELHGVRSKQNVISHTLPLLLDLISRKIARSYGSVSLNIQIILVRFPLTFPFSGLRVPLHAIMLCATVFAFKEFGHFEDA